MFEKADLVVIATFVSTKDTDEHTTLKEFDPPIKVVGITSEFTSSFVLKGAKEITTFQLHHYRLESEDDLEILDGPTLARFGSRHPACLMFLLKEPDGRYVPVTGQTDPYGLGVGELIGGGD
jgi:hypothetical protein